MEFSDRWKCGALLVLLAFGSRLDAATGCVWKVTSKDGGTLYLGGSVHSLRSTDYPLPPAYNQAFDACSRLLMEIDANSSDRDGQLVMKEGHYPKNDALKNHVDPRTYDYVRRFFGLLHIPESKIARCRPWLLVLFLESATMQGNSDDLGVEAFLTRRAKANSKPVGGLESFAEHLAVFSGLSDRQSEAVLLLTFIPPAEKGGRGELMDAWRRGDVDKLAAMAHAGYQDFSAFGYRLLEQRNRNWIPKIEAELHSGRTCFVVVGAAHLGGPAGLLELLRARGYQLERI